MQNRKSYIKIGAIFIFIVICAIFISLNQTPRTTIVDMAKNIVKLPEKIERVITLDPFSTQIMIALNLKELLIDAQYGTNLIGDGFSKVAPEFSKWGTSFSGSSIILENLVEKKPDLIIAQIGKPDINKIIELKIPVVQIDVENDQAFMGALNLIAEIFNKKARAAEISKFISIKLNEFYSTNEKNKNKAKPRIYVAGSNLLRTFGNASFQKWLVEFSGASFVTDSFKQLKVDISPETLIKLNPDYIILSRYTVETTEQILSDSRYANINAIKNKKIFKIPSFILSWDLPSFEMVAGIIYLRYVLGFNTIDELNDILISFYKTIYNLDLNIEDISKIISLK